MTVLFTDTCSACYVAGAHLTRWFLSSFVAYYVSGGVGIANMVEKMENQEYMGFENFCHLS